MKQPTIYESLADHQCGEMWKYQEVMRELHLWSERFNLEFKLEVPEITIGVEVLRHRLGQFRYGHNGLGLRREILIDRRHVEDNRHPEKWYEVLGTLLHEQLYAWQEAHGRPGKRNYHNREFCRKAADLGLIVAPNGYEQYEPDPDSPFLSLIEKHGVHIPLLPEPDRLAGHRKNPRRSKLKLWVCSCTPPVRVRVGRAVFEAQCLRCGCNFELVI